MKLTLNELKILRNALNTKLRTVCIVSSEFDDINKSLQKVKNEIKRIENDIKQKAFEEAFKAINDILKPKVYVLIWWFYEGDSHLVNSFEGVFSNYNKAMFRKNEIGRNLELVSTEEAEKRQNEHGYYGDPSFFEIRECVI